MRQLWQDFPYLPQFLYRRRLLLKQNSFMVKTMLMSLDCKRYKRILRKCIYYKILLYLCIAKQQQNMNE